MENEIGRDLLNFIKDLERTARHLAIHTEKHGINLEKANLFFVVFARFRKELETFYKHRKWNILRAFNIREPKATATTLKEIHTTHAKLIIDYATLIKNTLATLESAISQILKDKKIIARLKRPNTLSSDDTDWISSLPKYNWQMLYQHIEACENIDWNTLAAPEAARLKTTYKKIKDQYRTLSLVSLFPELKKLKDSIFKLRFESINYKKKIQSAAALEDFALSWNSLSIEFKKFSTQWKDITASISDISLHAIGQVLIKEYDSLVLQYYSLVDSHLLLFKSFQLKSSQYFFPSIQTQPTHNEIKILMHKKSRHYLNSAKAYNTHNLDKSLEEAIRSFTPSLRTLTPAEEEHSETESSRCATPIMSD